MLYWSETVGASVFIDNKKIGNIENAMLDLDRKVITGFLLERRNLDIRYRYFLYTRIQEKKGDSIILNDAAEINTLSGRDRKKVVLADDFLYHSILDEKGDWIGRVVDFGFDPSKGFVRDIILSGSFIEDIWNGRRRMPVLSQVEFSKELVCIDRDTRDEISVLQKGLRRWLGIDII